MFRFCFLLVFLSTVLPAQQEVSYHLRFIDAVDSSAIPFVRIAIDSADKIRGFAQAGVDGCATIRQAQIPGAKNVFVHVSATGYESVLIFPSLLIPNDTLVYALKLAPISLNEIILIRYEEPLIEPDVPEERRRRKRKKTEPPARDTLPAYSPTQIALFDSLRNGHYPITDSLRGQGSITYEVFLLQLHRMRIPQSSVEHKEEGTVYMEFDIDSNGYIQNIICVHTTLNAPGGRCVIMALHVAKILAAMPRIDWSQQYVWPHEPEKLATTRFRLPVRVVVN